MIISNKIIDYQCFAQYVYKRNANTLVFLLLTFLSKCAVSCKRVFWLLINIFMGCQWAIWNESKLVLVCCSLNMLLTKQKPFWFQWNWDLQWTSKSSQKISQQNIVYFYICDWENTIVWLECELCYLVFYFSTKRDISSISLMIWILEYN